MNNNDGPLSFEADIDEGKYHQKLAKMRNDTVQAVRDIGNESKYTDTLIRNLGITIAGAFTFQKGKEFVSDIIKVRGEFQQLEIAFTSMLQSKEKSNALMAQLVQTAATTPFSMRDVAQGAKQLIAYGTGAEKVNDTLIMLGNVASGLSVPLNDLVYLYGTLQSQGRAYATDIRQFAGRGIPIYEELGKVLGVSKDKVNALVEAGKVGFPEIQKVFENLTAKGGMFYNLMEEQSKSLTGQISNLGDAWDQMLNKIGQSNEGIFSSGIEAAQYLIEHYQEIGKILEFLIVTYGSYKAAVITTSVLEGIIASSKVATIYLEMAAGLGKLTLAHKANALAIGLEAAAQRALNVVMSVNPYVLVVTAIAAVTSAYLIFHDSTSNAEKAQKQFNDQLDEGQKKMNDLKTTTNELTSTIHSSTATQFEQLGAFKELQALYPDLLGKMSLHEFQALSAEDAQRKLNGEMDKASSANLQKQYDEAKTKIAELEKQLKVLYESLGRSSNDNNGLSQAIKVTADNLEQAKVNAELLNDKITDSKRLAEEAAEMERVKALPIAEQISYYQQIQEELTVQIEAIKASQAATGGVSSAVDILTGKVHGTSSAFGGLQSVIDGISLDNLNNRLNSIQRTIMGLTGVKEIKNKSYFEELQKKAKEDYENIPIDQLGSADAKQKKKDYDAATDALEKYSLKEKKEKKQNKWDKVLPTGSLGEYDRLLHKANEALNKTPVDQIQRVKDLQDTILKLTEQRAEAQRIIEVRTWAETLEYKKNQYLQYEQLIQRAEAGDSLAGILSGSSTFKVLLKDGQTYLDWIQNQFEPINKKITDGTATELDIAKYIQLKSLMDSLNVIEPPFDAWKASLDSLKADLGSGSAEYLTEVNRQISEIGIPKTEEQRKKLQELKQEQKATIAEQSNALRQFMQQLEGSATQLEAIRKQYEALKYAARNNPDQVAVIDVQEQAALGQVIFRNTEAYKAMNDVILGEGVNAVKKYLSNLDNLAAEQRTSLDEAITKLEEIKALYGENSDAFKQQADVVRAKTNDLKTTQNEQLKANQDLIDKQSESYLKIADSIGEVAGSLKDMPGVLGAIGSLLSGITGESGKFAANVKLAKDNLKATSLGGSADTGASISAAVQGISDLTNMLLNSIEKKDQNDESRALDAINFQVQINKALNEEIRLRSILAENVYFKDYAGRIKDAMAAATDAVTKYNSALANLATFGKALDGTESAIDWGNVGKGFLSGAGTGAAIGSFIGGGVFSVPAAAVGAIVGGVIGGAIGLISQKSKDLFAPLLEKYPDLIDANGQLNKTLAETLVATNQLSDNTKLWVQDLINASDAYEEAKKQITDIVSELSGNLGNDLRDALVGAFEDGMDAGIAFANSVEKTLNNVLSNLLFSAVFKNVFDNLQKELGDALMIYGQTGSLGNVLGAFEDFVAGSKEDMVLFNELLAQAKKAGLDAGLNLFGNDGNSSNPNSMSGAITGVSEQTANVLTGQINAIKINQASALNIMNAQLPNLTIIAMYSRYLASIDRRLAYRFDQSQRPYGVYEGP